MTGKAKKDYGFKRSTVKADDQIEKRKRIEEGLKLQRDYDAASKEFKTAAEEVFETFYKFIGKIDMEDSLNKLSEVKELKGVGLELQTMLEAIHKKIAPHFTITINPSSMDEINQSLNNLQYHDVTSILKMEDVRYSFVMGGKNYDEINKDFIKSMKNLAKSFTEPKFYTESKEMLGLKTNEEVYRQLDTLEMQVDRFLESYSEILALDSRSEADKQSNTIEGDTRTTAEKFKEYDFMEGAKSLKAGFETMVQEGAESASSFGNKLFSIFDKAYKGSIDIVTGEKSVSDVYDEVKIAATQPQYDQENPIVKPMESNAVASADISQNFGKLDLTNAITLDNPLYVKALNKNFQDSVF